MDKYTQTLKASTAFLVLATVTVFILAVLSCVSGCSKVEEEQNEDPYKNAPPVAVQGQPQYYAAPPGVAGGSVQY